MKPFLISIVTFSFTFSSLAQSTFQTNGVADEREKYYVLTHATIYTDYQTVLNDATLIIRDGKVEAAGKNLSVPKGAAEINVQGKFIYPSFIDIYSDYGIPELKREPQQGALAPQYESAKRGPYSWNQAVHPEIHADELYKNDGDKSKQLRELGFGAVSTHQQDGIVQGTGALVLTGNERENENIIKNQSAEYYSFNKGISLQQYPSSLMGSIALLRQTYYDAQWYMQPGRKAENNISLDELTKALRLPQIFQAGDVYSALRADKIGDEFSIQYIIKGNGDEYQQINEIKITGNPLIISLNFPRAYDFSDPYDAQLVSLAAMMHWEMAPANAAALEKAGITFCLTSADLKDKNYFLSNIRKAIDNGLSQKQALKSLTFTPAGLLAASDQLGSLEKGKIANFLICSDSIFSEKNVIFQNWVNGIPYIINSFDFKDLRGNYSLIAGPVSLNLLIEGAAGHPEATIKATDSAKLKVTLSKTDELITLSFHYPKDTSKGSYFLSGYLKGDNMEGTGQDADGNWIQWRANFVSPFIEKRDTIQKQKPGIESKIRFPFSGHGNDTLPVAENFLFKNATVWTNEPDGVLQNTDVLIQGGKISRLEKNISAPANTRVIDASGKFLTSGIIDEHSHIAISQGVNEGSHSVTSEVRIGDVLDPSDINIYRQLAGGVTSAHLLHGSANTIGGQTQLIKLRWGYAPEAMKFAGWPGFIKFALGENVKQSNWGDLNNIRFPQTRMGVEQTIYDAFIRAMDYKSHWSEYNGLSGKEKQKRISPRKNLQLNALAEILDGKRFITCHSYVQSEINMLMHVADSMHFKMNTFTHILEGYKVADKMKARGIFASSFSDWWAYKYEVYDAIPYNPSILTKAGVVTAVNSDDAEMARRLNQEAAKSIKYGGLSEEEAWKLCTLNPAKMLHIDGQTGSIKAGKDADVVLWNMNPLSIYAKCEITLVDGIMFYSDQEEKLKQEWIQKERTRLMNKMITAKQNGEPVQKPAVYFNQEWKCETISDGTGIGE
ncbi:MAG: amidohydrolase family protein [Chitinophagales bacterium]